MAIIDVSHFVESVAKNRSVIQNFVETRTIYVNDWTLRTTQPTARTQTWSGIAWSPKLRLFVAVCSQGSGTDKIITSPDGITWTYRNAPNNSTWFKVVWSQELEIFVAIATTGDSNRVMTSPDGINWTLRNTPAVSGQDWTDIAWSPELGIFVAVGPYDRVMTSPDGITWTTRITSNAFFGNFRGITWSPELGIFVAVAPFITMYSGNGIGWGFGVPANDTELQSVAWSPKLRIFAAVGDTGTTPGENRIMTSTDGIFWTARTSPDNTNFWSRIAWSEDIGMFVGLAYAGDSTRIMVSFNGISWIARTAPAVRAWSSITYAPELGYFCALAGDTGTTTQLAMTNLGDSRIQVSQPLIKKVYGYT